MTSPSTASELDRESDDDPQLSRVTVVVGRQRVDVGLPAGVSTSVLAGAIIDIAIDQLVAGSGVKIRQHRGQVDPHPPGR